MERRKELNRPSNAPDKTRSGDAHDDTKTRLQGGKSQPLGVARPQDFDDPPTEIRHVDESTTPRAPLDSAIELDDDALMEVEEEAVIIKEPPPPPVGTTIAPPAPRPAPKAPKLRAHDDALVAELARRAEDLVNKDVPVTLSRARVELGIALEVFAQDREQALAQYQAAHEATPDAEAPLMAARWLTPLQPVGPALALATAHTRISSDDAARAEHLQQEACLYRADGAFLQAQKAYRQALAINPTSPAALRGLESVLRAQLRAGNKNVSKPLAEHLEDMASAFTNEPRFAAWLHVERAQLLDAEGKIDAARSAFEIAMSLDGKSPEVRDVYTRHLLIHRATESLVQAWSDFSEQDADPARAARFEFVAGRLASERLDAVNQAITLHSRAADREKANVDVRRAALVELDRLHRQLGDPLTASQARERHLTLVKDPVRRAHEHRRLSETYELLGQHEDVVRHTLEVLQFDSDDDPSRRRLDRALDALGRHEERIQRWTAEAARVEKASCRAEAFVRAAQIAERECGERSQAEALYRSAWACDNNNTDAFDGLARLLARPASQPDEVIAEHARARIDLYEQAALSATDKERRIACLSKVAQIWEDELNQPSSALEVYRRLSDLDEHRRSVILGIQRCAAMASEYDLLVQSLVQEAKGVSDASLQRRLLLRAADVAAEDLNDADLAMNLIGRVLSRSPGDVTALRAAIRVNYKTRRYDKTLEYLRLLVKQTRRGPTAFALCVEMAVLLEEQLRRPGESVEAYRQAATHDPEHPIPQIEIPRILLGLNEYKKAADRLTELASHASNPEIRAHLLVQASDIYDDRLDELDRSVVALNQAYALVPTDEAVFERLIRVQLRRNKAAELVPVLEKRIESSEGSKKLALRFQLASLLAQERDFTRAVGLLRDVLVDDPNHVGAIRIYEHALRRLELWDELAALFHHQATKFKDPAVVLGALHEARYLEEHMNVTLREGTPGTLDRIRSIAPDDPFVYDALVRASGLTVANGQDPVVVADALSRLAESHQADSFMAAMLNLGAALVFEKAAAQESVSTSRSALDRYGACLNCWPNSLSAARGLLRVAQDAEDIPAQERAHTVLGRIESNAKDRAAHNAAAADSIASTQEDGHARAFDLYSAALRDDPDCGPAAHGVIGLLDKDVEPGPIADLLRTVLDTAKDMEQVVLVGSALGRVAREHLRDPNGAVEALRLVRDKSPGHVPTLLELAEVCAEMQLWHESAEVAESALGISNDRAEHIHALVVLSESHSHVQTKWSDARQEALKAERSAEALPLDERRAVAKRLAGVYGNIQDGVEQERLICMEIALAGTDPMPLRTLAARHNLETMEGSIAYIQSLNRVLTLADDFELQRQPTWLIEIGRLECTRLSRLKEGIETLREAIALDPSRIDSSLALADTLSSIGANEEASSELRSLLASMDPKLLDAARIATIVAMTKRELEAISHNAQASVAEEIMGYIGYGTPERIQSFRNRTLPNTIPQESALDRATLERMVVPPVGQGAMFRIASAIEDVSHKLLRIDPSGVGATSSMRLSARSSHPRRQMANRLARAFGSLSFDLYVDVPSLTTTRVLPGSPACILLPPRFDNLPFNEQAVSITRLLSAIALGVPWIEEVSNGDLEGWMFGALQEGRPGWDGGGLPEAKGALASSWKPLIHKAINRKTRRVLDEIAGNANLDMDPIAWRHALRLATWRCALVVTGDWTSTINYAWRSERDLSGVAREHVASTMFEHAVLRDLCLWGISPDTTPLLRALGHPT